MSDNFKQQYFPICELHKVSHKKPLRCLLLNTPIIVYRAQNDIVAFIDKCPHRGVPLSSGKIINNEIQCPYHGWQFNQLGQCTKVPGLCSELKSAGKALASISIKVKYNLVFACLQPTDATLPIFKPSHYQSNNHHTFIWQSTMNGELINILENFLDSCHTHYVHQVLLRTQKNRQQIDVDLTVDETSATVTYHDGQSQTGLISKLFEPKRTHSTASFYYPFNAQIEYFNQNQLHFAISVFICPMHNQHYKVFSLLTHQQTFIPNFLKKWLFLPFIKLALKQDKRILQQQHNNLKHFEDNTFASTELDILRPHLERIMRQSSKTYAKQLKVNL